MSPRLFLRGLFSAIAAWIASCASPISMGILEAALLGSVVPILEMGLPGGGGLLTCAPLAGKWVGLPVPRSIRVGARRIAPLNRQMGPETIEAVTSSPEEMESLNTGRINSPLKRQSAAWFPSASVPWSPPLFLSTFCKGSLPGL